MMVTPTRYLAGYHLMPRCPLDDSESNLVTWQRTDHCPPLGAGVTRRDIAASPAFPSTHMILLHPTFTSNRPHPSLLLLPSCPPNCLLGCSSLPGHTTPMSWERNGAPTTCRWVHWTTGAAFVAFESMKNNPASCSKGTCRSAGKRGANPINHIATAMPGARPSPLSTNVASSTIKWAAPLRRRSLRKRGAGDSTNTWPSP